MDYEKFTKLKHVVAKKIHVNIKHSCSRYIQLNAFLDKLIQIAVKNKSTTQRCQISLLKMETSEHVFYKNNQFWITNI